MNADDPQLCGAAEIAEGRWILWSLEWSPSISHCVLTLNEKWFSKDLTNGFIRIHFDGMLKRLQLDDQKIIKLQL